MAMQEENQAMQEENQATEEENQAKQFANKLNKTLLTVISRGVTSDLENLIKYHMKEVEQIRNYMMSFVDITSGPYELNQYFYSALKELDIKLVDLVRPIENKAVTRKENAARIAM